MTIVHDKSLRKPTGGRYKNVRAKRKYLMASKPSLTGIGAERLRERRVRGGTVKQGLLLVEVVNLYDPKTKKHIKAKIKTVKESNANRNFVRRNILTKGAVIETDKGLAIVTNRPGQEKIINAILK
jgi:small subunit ribosomal protein S8e